MRERFNREADAIKPIRAYRKESQPLVSTKKTGRWIDWEYGTVYCSVCGKFNKNHKKSSICPNCNAKMEVEE